MRYHDEGQGVGVHLIREDDQAVDEVRVHDQLVKEEVSHEVFFTVKVPLALKELFYGIVLK